MKYSIDVVLATYNGSRYLKEQIVSILNQSPAVHLYIRDDLSNDDTSLILQDYQKAFPDRITVLKSESRLGIKGNFSRLLEETTSDYVLFADQDDLWLPGKVELTLKRMRKLEEKEGKEKPLLVHTDLIVTDEGLKTLHPSFWRYTHLIPKKAKTFNRLIVQNVITGCTMMLNRPLIQLVLPIPSEALMHDWWCGLAASAFGSIGEVEEATILYRQHQNNTLGAKRFGSLKHLYEGFKKLVRKDLSKKKQARIFYDRYKNMLSTGQKRMLEDYLRIDTEPLLFSRYLMLKNRFFKNGFLRNAASFLFQRTI